MNILGDDWLKANVEEIGERKEEMKETEKIQDEGKYWKISNC